MIMRQGKLEADSLSSFNHVSRDPTSSSLTLAVHDLVDASATYSRAG